MRDPAFTSPRKTLLLVTPPVAITVTISILAFIIGFIFWDALGRYRESLTAEQQRTVWTASLTVSQLDRQLAYVGHTLDHVVAPGRRLSVAAVAEAPAVLEPILDALVDSEPLLDMAMIWDEAGMLVAGSRRSAGTPADAARLFAAASSAGDAGFHVAVARIGPPDAPRQVLLTARWTGTRGSGGARLLAVGIAASRLAELLPSPPARQDDTLEVYRPDGVMLYPLSAAPPPAALSLAMGREDQGSLTGIAWPDGTRRVAAFQRMPRGGLVVVAGASEAAADEAFAWGIRRNAPARLFVILLVVTVGIALVRRTRHQTTLLGRVALWEQAAEANPHAVLILDATRAGRPLAYANPAYEALTGLSRVEGIGQPCPLLAAPDADPETRARLADALASGQAFHGELALRHRDGAHAMLEVDLDPVQDDRGQIANFVCRLRDITDRRRAAQTERAAQLARDWAVDELRKALDRIAVSEGRFRDFASSASDWFWEADETGRLVWLSDNAQHLPGWHVGDVPPLPRLRGLADGAGPPADFRGERAHAALPGRDLILEVSGRPVLATDGTCLGYRGVVKDITEQERISIAARRDELRLAAAVEDLPIGLLIVDADNRVLLCNARYCDLFAVERPQRGDHWRVMSGLVLDRMREHFDAATIDAVLAERRRLSVAGTGSMTLPWMGGRTYRLEERKLAGGDRTVVVVDVTELEESRARLLDAVQNITSGFAIFDIAGRLVLGNEAFYDQVTPYMDGTDIDGLTAHEIFTRVARAGMFRLMQIDGRPASPEEVAMRVELATGDPFLMATPDGRTLQVRLRQSGDGGRVVIYSDVSLLRQMDAALRSSEAKFRGLAQASGDGIMIVDPSGEIQFANEEARRLFGYDDEDTAFDNVMSLIPAESHGVHDTLMAGFFAERRSRSMDAGRPLRAVRRDGTTFPVEVALSYYETPDGPLAQATIRDITMRLRAEEAERQRGKMVALGTLAGGIAHDLNNALVPILSLSELLLDSGTASPEDAEMLGTIVTAAERARDLVRNILAFSRRGARNVITLDLGAIVAKDLPMLRAVISASIQLHYRAPAEPVPVLADETNLHQVVVNLVSNAAQAIGAAVGRIDITVAAVDQPDAAGGPPAGRYARLAITDTGPGMDEETRQRLFEPFFTTKPVGEGTGLGLAIVHGIVGSHGGTISVDSAPGRGTTFTIWFPLRPPAALPSA